jgi:L-asparaginase / beta-aspartyl-peptidase
LERGNSFFRKGQQLAQEQGLSFNWKLEYVEGVGHNSAKMAPLAAQYISDYISSNTVKGKWQYPSPPEPGPISTPPAVSTAPEAEMQSTPAVTTVSSATEGPPLMDFAICIHGGAGVISKSDTVAEQFTQALRDKIRRCHYFACDDPSRTAVDIAEFAVNLLENDPLFNAGIGAVFTTDETHELEASIMEGSSLACGASALLTNVKNPISLARKVMEGGKHVWIAGNPGEALAEMADLELVESNDEFSVPRRLAQLERAKELQGVFNDHDLGVASSEEKGEPDKESTVVAESVPVIGTGPLGPDGLNLDDEINTETVGCVVMRNGHVCAATSTGGMTNKSSGRIGDTPMIGCGTYANDKTCAVSATGKGNMQPEQVLCRILAH